MTSQETSRALMKAIDRFASGAATRYEVITALAEHEQAILLEARPDVKTYLVAPPGVIWVDPS